jgi:two-component system sensor histidine kinase AlgZ
MLRLLLGANLLALLAALLQTPTLAASLPRYVETAAFVEPLLLIVLGLLALLRDSLRRLPVRAAQTVIALLCGLLAAGQHLLWAGFGLSETAGELRSALLAMAGALTLLSYFELRAHAFSPAQAEARLVALNARIRPHFLFNSLNAVLSLIRARPQQAEQALEALSDLFRAAMRDPAELVSLSDEIELCRQYLDLEKLRLGERLAVDWQIEAIPTDTPIPPLMLQPLIENAVYHGIEPRPEGGEIVIHIRQSKELLLVTIRNPNPQVSSHSSGNRRKHKAYTGCPHSSPRARPSRPLGALQKPRLSWN